MARKVYTRVRTKEGDTEHKPEFKGGKDKANRGNGEKQDPGPEKKPAQQPEPLGPDLDADSPDAVYVVQATKEVAGVVSQTVVGAYSHAKLLAFLSDHGYTMGQNGIVYPIYRVIKTEVQK